MLSHVKFNLSYSATVGCMNSEKPILFPSQVLTIGIMGSFMKPGTVRDMQ